MAAGSATAKPKAQPEAKASKPKRKKRKRDASDDPDSDFVDYSEVQDSVHAPKSKRGRIEASSETESRDGDGDETPADSGSSEPPGTRGKSTRAKKTTPRADEAAIAEALFG